MALFLHDVLTVLHKISLKFQQDRSVLADVPLTIKIALSRIKSPEARLSKKLIKIPNYLSVEVYT